MTQITVFATIPSLERRLDVALKKPFTQVILDFTNAYRCETCVGSLIKRKVAEYVSEARPQPLRFAGISPNHGLVIDLSRGGVSCNWPQFLQLDGAADQISCFPNLSDAIQLPESLPQSVQHHVSDDDVLEEVDQLLGSLPRGSCIRTLTQVHDITIHQLKAGEILHLLSTPFSRTLGPLLSQLYSFPVRIFEADQDTQTHHLSLLYGVLSSSKTKTSRTAQHRIRENISADNLSPLQST